MTRFWSASGGLGAAVLLASLTTAASGDDWDPVTPAELGLAAPRVDRGADAEALFWDVHVEDRCDPSGCEVAFTHYLRIKIFTEAGKQNASRVDIPYSKDVRIDDISGRTLHADGSVVRLGKRDIFDRTIVKARGFKYQARSFVLPAVEVGSIIEYRWTELRINQLSAYVRLQFQRDIPVERVTYHVRPLQTPGAQYSMYSSKFHGTMTPFVRDEDGFYATSMDNVPAFREEPHMPPEAQVRPWMLLYYLRSDEESSPPDKYWTDFGKQFDGEVAALSKPSRTVRDAATRAIAGASGPEEKLDRLWRVCRGSIRNVSAHPEGLSDHDRKLLTRKSTADDILDRGFGSGWDIEVAFAALARGAGFDARVVPLSHREDLYFTPQLANAYFLNAFDVAVKLGDEWRFLDPANPLLRPGALRWSEEGVSALIPDPRASVFVTTPVTPAESSAIRRVAVVALTEDGDLDGHVRIEFSGHPALDERGALAGESEDAREELVRELMKSRLEGAALTDIHITGADDVDQPLVYNFLFRAPGYAQHTGKRLFLQPAVLEHSLPAVFPSPQRVHPVDFHYGWLESDSVVISLPEGYELDHPDAPEPASVENYGDYRPSLAMAGDGNFVIYRRTLRMSHWYVDLSQYDLLKGFFDAVHEQDGHLLALRRREAPQDSTAAGTH